MNRILAIAAVHELLTERRDEDVDLADLIDRLRAMLVQGVGGGKEVTATLEPVSFPARGRRRSRSCSPSCSRTRSSTAATRVSVELRAARRRRRARDRRRRRRDREGGVAGTGLSIVSALVRDELRGTLELRRRAGRAPTVVFPA